MVDGFAVVNDKDVEIERKVKCVVLGDNTVGKTCLLLQLSYTSNTMTRKHLESFSSTYLANIKVAGKIYQLELWDTECEEATDKVRPVAYTETDVFCLCFSIADADSFRHIKEKWYREVKHFSPHSPIILVGTKLDLRDEKRGKKGADAQIISYKAGKKMAQQIGAIKYIECSALKQKGYAYVFSEAIKATISKSRKAKCTVL